jgi:hypothetical protein
VNPDFQISEIPEAPRIQTEARRPSSSLQDFKLAGPGWTPGQLGSASRAGRRQATDCPPPGPGRDRRTAEPPLTLAPTPAREFPPAGRAGAGPRFKLPGRASMAGAGIPRTDSPAQT